MVMTEKHGGSVTVRGEGLSIPDLARVARSGARVAIARNASVLRRIADSERHVQRTLAAGRGIYGVTTGVGSNAGSVVPLRDARDMQENLVWFLKAGTGPRLPAAEVRAGMLLRLNSLARGASGIRLEVLRRIALFLNAGATPVMFELGSIGASGDLVPLAYLAGSIAGLDRRFRVDYRGRTLAAPAVLSRLGVRPLRLEAKEGLALVNGTSVMTGIAALAVDRARTLVDLSLATHALYIQALNGSVVPFDPFVHRQKPHAGQIRAAAAMRRLLAGSRMTYEGMKGRFPQPRHSLVQDRYSLRCLPQYLAPVLEGLDQTARWVEVEMNAATDNPLVDARGKRILNSGNFLGESVAVGMDHLRHYLALVAKHLDVQISILVSPEFNEGLPPSLVGNAARPVNMGLKSLQIVGNSIVPLLEHLGHPIADRYPTHAEHFNQNINSQGWNGAILARRSVETFERHLAVALVFAVQAADLRARQMTGSCDPRGILSPATRRLYEAVRAVVGRPPSRKHPYIHDDSDVERDDHLERIAGDISAGGWIPASLGGIG